LKRLQAIASDNSLAKQVSPHLEQQMLATLATSTEANKGNEVTA